MKNKRSLSNLKVSIFLIFQLLAVQSFAQETSPMPLKQHIASGGIPAEVTYQSSYGNGQRFGYLEYLPSNYAEATAKFPLLISLHGIGQRGAGNQIEFDKLRRGGQLAKRIMQGQSFPFIIITPQQPEDVKGRYEGRRQWDPYIIDEILERVKGQRKVDLSRVYICGESMGGGGVWSYLELFGDKIAAAVPIAGTKTIGVGAVCNTKINNTPIWAFHADGDPVVNVKNTLDIVNTFNKCNPPVKARQTIFSGRSHNVWDWVYDFKQRALASKYKNDAFGPASRSKDIFSWMLSFRSENNELAVTGNQGEEATDKEEEVANTMENEISGLRYAYYEGSWTTLPDFNRIRPESEGIVSDFLLSPRKKDVDFAFRYKGYLTIDHEGEYKFYTSSDDGSKLYIDGQLLVDNDGQHSVRERQGEIQLTPGLHAIEVVFFQRLGNQHLEVSYSGPNFSKMAIPSEKLFAKINHPSLRCRNTIAEPIGNFVKAYPSHLEDELKVEFTGEVPVNTIITLYNQYGNIYYTKSVLLSPDEQLHIDLFPLHVQRGFVYMKVESESSAQTIRLFKN